MSNEPPRSRHQCASRKRRRESEKASDASRAPPNCGFAKTGGAWRRRAEKVAQANLIRRREETAATRSLLNTARFMEENPTLLRLKELETLERVTEKVTVCDGLEGVLTGMVPRISV